MFGTNMLSCCVALFFMFSACVDINMAKSARAKRNSCVYTEHTNGCSTPVTWVPNREKFEPACNEHDVCYFCGDRYGISRSQCDVEFRQKMYEICDSSRKRFLWSAAKNLFTGNPCKAVADAYYGAVHNFGGSHYVKPSPHWCEQTCVQNLLQKYYNLVV